MLCIIFSAGKTPSIALVGESEPSIPALMSRRRVASNSGYWFQENRTCFFFVESGVLCNSKEPSSLSTSARKSIRPQFLMAQISEVRELLAKTRHSGMYLSDALPSTEFENIAFSVFMACTWGKYDLSV
jgi:hypothetical protein